MENEKLKLEDLLEGRNQFEDGAINNIAIIGAGVMGQGIAQTIAAAGLEVLLIEKDNQHLEKARNVLSSSIDREIKFDRIKDCDLVIEAVDEDFELKKGIFQKVDLLADKDAIFVSNTSTLSLTKIAESTSRPEKVIGMHFLHPVPKVPVVELIKCLHTSNETVEKTKAFTARIGKTPVEVYEYPGFVTTRAIVPLLNEAMYILLEGVATAKDIDTAMRLGYNFQMGPLELADSMGLDEVLAWMETLWKTLGEPRYRACPILRKLVRERKLGKKTGEGFYKYDEFGNIINE